MRLYLEVIEGPSRGRKFSLKGPTSFGRKGSDILLNDVKLSGVHVFFDYQEDQGWVILDNESRNGVWINGMKERRHVVVNGDEVLIGSTKMRCRLLDASTFKLTDKFKRWVQGLYKPAKNQESGLGEIRPEIRLRMVQGCQYGEFWDIFYGPRMAGKDSVDICLREKSVPQNAFEIRIKGKYAYFYTDHENTVKINKQSVKEKQFTPGDIISFGDSEILVEIDEGHGFSN